ncbi:hypothetical protein [Aquimarina rhabdastrellae]
MKKKQITALTCLMLGLGGLGLHAQSGSYSAEGSQVNNSPSWGQDINQNDGVIIRADNNNDRNQEAIRFVIGRLDNNSAGSYTAEFNRAGLQIRGLNNADYANLHSIRGLDIHSNSDRNNTNEPIRFRVSKNNSTRTIANMSYDDGLEVLRPSRFSNELSVTGNLYVGGRSGSQARGGIEINGGRAIYVASGRYRSSGALELRPGVNNEAEDKISFRNSSNEEMAKVQDGELFLRRSGSDGGLISSNGMLRFQPDNNNTGDDRIVFLNQRGNEMTRIQDGVITTDQVRLNVTTFPDYVFAKDYKLMPLKEVAQYIKANKHLPNMPTEAEVVAEGMNVGQINTVLVEKVEELTLHTINQEKKIEQLMKKIEALEAAMNK